MRTPGLGAAVSCSWLSRWAQIFQSQLCAWRRSPPEIGERESCFLERGGWGGMHSTERRRGKMCGASGDELPRSECFSASGSDPFSCPDMFSALEFCEIASFLFSLFPFVFKPVDLFLTTKCSIAKT